MTRIPAKYAKYYDRKYRAKIAREALAAFIAKRAGDQETSTSVDNSRSTMDAVISAEAVDASVEISAVSDSQNGGETEAIVGSPTEDTVVEGGNDETESSPDTSQASLPKKEREVMPDYSSMTWQELRKLISSEEEATLPDLKKATLVQYLVQKWEESGD